MYIDINHVCRPDGETGFNDIFSWLPYSTYAGTKEINGRQCDDWILRTATTNLSLCTVGNNPVELRYNLSAYPYVFGYEFRDDIVVGKPDPAIFKLPERCLNPMLCPGSNTSTEFIDAYIFHPHYTTGDIVNQDVADLAGDAAFICEGTCF